jgi:peptidoglycan-N-acetylglucosamine deacetylase
MTKHRIILIIYFTAVAVWCMLMWPHVILVVTGIAVSIALYSVILAIGAFRIQMNYYLHSFKGVKTDKKVIALTFDDGPNKYTGSILKVLRRHRLHATFFLIGKNVEKDAKTARTIAKDGHEIGNHTWSHSAWFDFFTGRKMELDIIRADESIKKATGKTPKYFRPPYGVTNPILARVMRRFSFTIVGWRFRTMDTVIKDPDEVCERILKNVRNGDIIVFHDYNRNAPVIAEKVIRWFQKNGFRIVSLGELMKYGA